MQPSFLDIPSRPEWDFLWSYTGSVVVGQRIKDAFTKAEITGIEFYPITLRKVGKLSPNIPPPIPESGEPEDIVEEVELLPSVENIGNYYEMIIVAESSQPPGAEVKHICLDCGRETIDNTTRRLEMHPYMWKGQDTFFLATTLWIVITDRVKQILEQSSATNVQFKPL